MEGIQLHNRREFLSRSTAKVIAIRFGYVALASGTSLELAGCSVWTDIENWVPVGEAGLNAILDVLTSNGIVIAAPVQATVNLVEAGFTALIGAINTYKSTTPPPVGAEQKVQAALAAIVTNFKTFLASLNVPGTMFSVITGLAQVILSTIAAFENQLPATTTGAAPATRTSIAGSTANIGTQTITFTPKARSRRSFKRDWNSTLDAGAKAGVKVPQSAYLKLTFFEHMVP